MFLSFIVPVYNTEKYIAECLNSLLEQDISADEYEIICVNDGSKDGSLNILNSYASTRSNINIIDQQNSGVSVARNTGLEQAKGDYIWFIDSDDLIEKNCLSELQKIASTKQYDRIVIGNRLFKNIDDLKSDNLKINSSWKDSVVWRNIFRRDFLNSNNLRYCPGLVFGEDALFLFECFRCKPEILDTELLIYNHRDVDVSASNNHSFEFIQKRTMSTLQEAKIVQKYYEQNDGIYPMETANRLMIFLWGCLNHLTQMTRKEAKPYLDDLKSCGLYPYKTPPECTVTKSFQLSRSDLFGKFFDYVYTHMHRPWGFHAMRIINRLMNTKGKNF